mgnify:CR=1 FL=1
MSELIMLVHRTAPATSHTKQSECYNSITPCICKHHAWPLSMAPWAPAAVHALGARRLRSSSFPPLATPSSAAETANGSSPSSIVASLRELVKSSPPPSSSFPAGSGGSSPSSNSSDGRGGRQELDARADQLLSSFRAATCDGSKGTGDGRHVAGAIWAAGKLATPCCLRHGRALLQGLTGSVGGGGGGGSAAAAHHGRGGTGGDVSAGLAQLSNQSVSTALYAAALLSRQLPGGGRGAGGGGSASSDKGNSGSGAPRRSQADNEGQQEGRGAREEDLLAGLRAPAEALAAACLPRLDSLNAQDVANTW